MRGRVALAAAALVASACGAGSSESLSRQGGAGAPPPPVMAAPPSTEPSPPPPPITREVEEPAAPAGAPRPDWLGRRPLPLRPDGFGEVRPTPPELDPRHLATPDATPAPDGAFVATVEPVLDEVVARSTWAPECPVARDDLRHVSLTFWGFDERAHSGELLVHAEVAPAVVEVFRALFEARFPIEEMRITRADELDAPPTGDGNNTGGFVCRPVSGGSSWSQHAYGRAIDVNPFHNPYVRGALVVPELASTYAARGDVRPGMIVPGGVVEKAFDSIGWRWGGRWSSVKDWMHFSATGR